MEAFEDMQATILTRSPYTLTGAPIAVQVPYFGRFMGENSVERPLAYAVPANIAEHLGRHGLTISEIERETVLDAEILTVRRRVFQGGRDILESSTTSHLQVEGSRYRRALPEGWWLVYTEQPRGAIAAYLCEAGSDDGLLTCDLMLPPEPGAEFPAWRIHAIRQVERSATLQK